MCTECVQYLNGRRARARSFFCAPLALFEVRCPWDSFGLLRTQAIGLTGTLSFKHAAVQSPQEWSCGVFAYFIVRLPDLIK